MPQPRTNRNQRQLRRTNQPEIQTQFIQTGSQSPNLFDEFGDPDNRTPAQEQALSQYKDSLISFYMQTADYGQQVQVREQAYQDHKIGYFPAYQILRRIGQYPIIRMIKNKRQAQLTKFAKAKSTKSGLEINETGFNLKFSDGRRPTSEEVEILDRWEKRICEEFFFPPHGKSPSMVSHLSAAYNDFVDMDVIALEKIRMVLYDKPTGVSLMDPTLIYPVIKKVSERDVEIINRQMDDFSGIFPNIAKVPITEPDYLMIVNEIRHGAFTKDQLELFHLNVSTDFQRINRGNSYVEQAIQIIAWAAGLLSYNASNFNEQKIPNGILILKGTLGSNNFFETMKRNFSANMTDSKLKNRMMTMSVPSDGDAQWLNLKNTAKDEEYHQFFVLITTILCYVFNVAPEEIGMPSFKTIMKKATLNDTADDGLIKQAADEGIRLFLQYYANCLNSTKLLKAYTGLDVECEFVGFESEDKKQKADLNSIRLRNGDVSINDIREENQQERAKNPFDIPGIKNIYDVPGLNNPLIQQMISTYVNNQQQMQMQQQQQEMQMQQQGQQPGQDGQPQPGQDQAQGQGDGDQIDPNYVLTEEDYANLAKYGISREEADKELEEKKKAGQR